MPIYELKWDLKNKVFNTLKDVQQEDLAKYGLQIKIPDCKVKRAILKYLTRSAANGS